MFGPTKPSASTAYCFYVHTAVRLKEERPGMKPTKIRPCFCASAFDNIPREWLRLVEPHVVRGAFLPCWIWAGKLDNRGYPRLHYRDPRTGKSKYLYVHRLVVTMFWDVPPRWYVKRTCQTLNCVNPH